MTVAPILKYPGAKWRIALWLHRCTPVCPRVVDCFGGSGAFLLTLRYEPQHLIYNDLDQDVVNLFRVLRDADQRAALITAVTFTPWSRAEYRACVGGHGRINATGDPVEDARRFLVATWQACKTNTSTRNGWRNQGTASMQASTWQLWRQMPERLAVAAERLTRAEIECMDALTLIARFARSAETLIYADPPYLRTTVHGTRRRLYRHELGADDHRTLLDALDAHPGPVLLSGYASDLYAERLAHWTRHQIDTRAEGAVARTECLWCNPVAVERLGHGPLFADGADGGAHGGTRHDDAQQKGI